MVNELTGLQLICYIVHNTGEMMKSDIKNWLTIALFPALQRKRLKHNHDASSFGGR